MASKVYLEAWLPIKPFSANSMHYAKYKRDTALYKAFKRSIAKELDGDYGIQADTKLKLTLIAGFTNRASDLDNAFKPLIDSMQLCMEFDDKQIYEIVAYKDVKKKKEGYLYIKLEEIKQRRLDMFIDKLMKVFK